MNTTLFLCIFISVVLIGWLLFRNDIEIFLYELVGYDCLRYTRIYFDGMEEAKKNSKDMKKYFGENRDKLSLLKIRTRRDKKRAYIDVWYIVEMPGFKPEFEPEFEKFSNI